MSLTDAVPSPDPAAAPSAAVDRSAAADPAVDRAIDRAAAGDLAVDRAGTDPAGQSRRPSFTITDAAAACAVSRKTITRKLPELALNGAAKDDDGIWRIPVEALLAVGLHPGRSIVVEPRAAVGPPVEAHAPMPSPAPTGPDMVTISRDRWDDVRIRLARAEAEAAERALALADARLALRALTAGPAAEPARGSAHPASGAIALGPGGGPVPPEGGGAPELAEDLFDARSHAARNGYASIAAAPARKRRWWQSA